jgi:WXG100 family type VII secretion target
MPAPIVCADYNKLAQIASSFGAQAGLMRKNLQELRARQATLQEGDWAGQGATSFYSEMDDIVLPALQRLINALEAAASTTGQISAILKAAEDQSARVLKGTGELEQIMLVHEGPRRQK